MTTTPISGVYNDGYLAELYERYRSDPAAVDESWRHFFRFAESLSGVGPVTTVAADASYLRKVAGAAALMDAIRIYGH
ncbi:MAG TPA: hypothetical protein VNL96_05970, partial [Gemmatimonadaceae bacterium]|nr:hypothetical protein [Gemmatimonadaceae bacterium]